MSNVVAFRPRVRKRPAASSQTPFQLLFFTGVRYERHDRHEPAKAKRSRSAPAKAPKSRRA